MPGNKAALRASRKDEAPQGAASAPSPSDQSALESSGPAAATPVAASSFPLGRIIGGVLSGALSPSSSEPSPPENATSSGGPSQQDTSSPNVKAGSSRWGKMREATVHIPASSPVVPTQTIDSNEEL